jgi:hypothetical protein
LVLAERCIAHPGCHVSAADLIASGWPGERVRDHAAKNRLYVALDGLRRLGLRSVLLRKDDGWHLDPGLSCTIVREQR